MKVIKKKKTQNKNQMDEEKKKKNSEQKKKKQSKQTKNDWMKAASFFTEMHHMTPNLAFQNFGCVLVTGGKHSYDNRGITIAH